MTMTTEFDPFAGELLGDVAPVTPEQEEIWLNIQLGGTPANLAYNQPIAFRLRGRLSAPALERAFQRVIARHDALRATMSPDGASLCFLENAIESFRQEEVSASGLESALRRIVAEPFDLVRGPLIRAHLLARSETE